MLSRGHVNLPEPSEWEAEAQVGPGVGLGGRHLTLC